MIDWLESDANGQTIETVLINCHYPVSNNEFVLQYGAIVRSCRACRRRSRPHGAQFAEGVEMGFEQDVEIWKNKAPIDNPLLSEEDGPVYQLRRWYQQFYVDVEDITEDMTKRFEFEIDTTRAVASWEQEVAENMAKQAPKLARELLASGSPNHTHPEGNPDELRSPVPHRGRRRRHLRRGRGGRADRQGGRCDRQAHEGGRLDPDAPAEGARRPRGPSARVRGDRHAHGVAESVGRLGPRHRRRAPWQLAFADPKVQQEVWGEDQDTWLASPYMPGGMCVPVDGGYKFSGKWSFSSGTDHCDWAFLGAFACNPDGSMEMPPGCCT